MVSIDIVYPFFLNENGDGRHIGGIETYIATLCSLLKKMRIPVRVVQKSSIGFFQKDLEDGNTKVVGVPVRHGGVRMWTELVDYALLNRNKSDKILTIIGNDVAIPSYKIPNSICIQHGIGFDVEINKKGFSSRLGSFLLQTAKAYYRIRRIENVDEVVCVDYNYINWFRTQVPNSKVCFTPILNFTKINTNSIVRDDSIIKIVFARRFFGYRGTRLFSESIQLLLMKYNNIDVTFAGDGPDEEYLKDKFSHYKNVHFTKYKADESLKFHEQFHIAVVPSIASEGSSLSLLEAMSSRCAVVCTYIGGMSNVIINNYNGLMVSPNVRELSTAIEKLIVDKELRERVAAEGFNTVKTAFSLERWENQWKEVIGRRINI